MMRALLSIVAGVALAVAGTVAVAGSGYTPPASSGGGVEGDGTGVTDASAFRSALSLGTAATANTGTAMGNVVVLGMGATLPIVNASNLTGISASQISGLGTAATVNTGTGAGNVVVLNSSAQLPAVDGSLVTNVAPYAADVWDYEWNASAGTTMEADGWTKTGTLTDTSTTIGSYTARLLTPAANTGAAYMSKVIVTNSGGLAPVTGLNVAGPFELRVLVQLPASVSTSIVHAFAFCMQATGNQFIPAVTSTALWASGGTGTLTSLVLTGGLPNRSLWITIRSANGISSGTTAATGYTELWAGGVRLWTGVSSTPWASFTGGSEGLLRVGRIVGPGSGGNVEAVKVASIKWRAGWNAAPVDYTMRSLNGALGP